VRPEDTPPPLCEAGFFYRRVYCRIGVVTFGICKNFGQHGRGVSAIFSAQRLEDSPAGRPGSSRVCPPRRTAVSLTGTWKATVLRSTGLLQDTADELSAYEVIAVWRAGNCVSRNSVLTGRGSSMIPIPTEAAESSNPHGYLVGPEQLIFSTGSLVARVTHERPGSAAGPA
jgi:hypothetical protein